MSTATPQQTTRRAARPQQHWKPERPPGLSHVLLDGLHNGARALVRRAKRRVALAVARSRPPAAASAAPNHSESPAAAPPAAPDDVALDTPPGEPSDKPDLWGEMADRLANCGGLGWLDNPWIVENYVFPQIFGTTTCDRWGENAVRAFGVPLGGRWLSLACGGAGLELQMAERGLFASMVAVDISTGAIEVGRREAASRGLTQIDFQQADVNTISLPAESYDVVFMNMSLHHISALERVAAQINKTLRPGGVFLANEFVGPSQFQYPDQRLEMVRHRLSLLPERLRWNPIAKEIKREYPRYPRRHWVAYDPTESVRSDEIPRVLQRNFPALRRYDYGGSILNLALENIHHNFDLTSSEDMAYLRDLIEFERSMIRSGILSSDFAYFVCPRGPRFVRLRERVRGRFDVRHRLTMTLRRHGLG